MNLAYEQGKLGLDTEIWCTDLPPEIAWATRDLEPFPAKVRGFRALGPRRLAYSREMESWAGRSVGPKVGVAHQHAIWTAMSRVTTMLRSVHGFPTVVAPHGSLDAWALQKSRWRKRLARIAYEDGNLAQASCLHATAEAEVANFRDYGLLNPIAVIPNGVSSRWLESRGEESRFRERVGLPCGVRVLLFMSRITPKKGLPLLLQGMSELNQLGDWFLVIVGSDEFGHQAEVEQRVVKLGLGEKVKFVSPQYGQAKRDAFAAADIFVLPSLSEGAPIAVLDSLAAGVPVLTTKAAPWATLVESRCGWWVDASIEGLREGLREACSMSAVELAKMGSRGRELVSRSYTWEKAARETSLLYGWLLGRHGRPDFVVPD